MGGRLHQSWQWLKLGAGMHIGEITWASLGEAPQHSRDAESQAKRTSSDRVQA